MPKLHLLLKLAAIAATSRSTRTFYDRVAPFYDRLFTDHVRHAEKMVRCLGGFFLRRANIRVLDLACGTGTLSRRLQEQGFRVTGLDFSLQSLRGVKQGAGTIPLLQADAAALPFGPTSFDVVTCLGAWRHFPQPQRTLNDICRVLHPDGIFLVGYFPPQLGGLFSPPAGRIGKVTVGLYSRAIRLLKYQDRVDQETVRATLQMFDRAFAEVRRIESGKDKYLIWAAGTRRGAPP